VFTIQLRSLGWVSEFFEVRAQVDHGLTTVDHLTGYLRLIKNLGRHSWVVPDSSVFMARKPIKMTYSYNKLLASNLNIIWKL
jgi:hypothetical protein